MNRVIIDIQEDRYSRLRMLPWWDQELLRRSKVMVVGAGALGNEIVKNLALVGTGSVLIVDFDTVEASNLSRSVLFTLNDEGSSKAAAAARAAGRINPDSRFYHLNADVTWQVGLGLFRWADVVIGGLDNREARLAVNRACWKVGTPWVDGATEAFQGIVRVFVPPDGPCYECTLSEQDQRIMAVRDSCGFFAREAYRQGRTPTTPTTSAVIAGIQVQEAIKLIHSSIGPHNSEPDSDGQITAAQAPPPVLAGKGFFFDGVTYDCFTIEYARKHDCLSHTTFAEIVKTDLVSKSATIADVASIAEQYLGSDVTIELPCEMVTWLRCTRCGADEEFIRLLCSISADQARCPNCGFERVPNVVAECSRGSGFRSIPLVDLGFGIMDILPARSANRQVQIEISGDLGIIIGDAGSPEDRGHSTLVD
ncbi:MAG: ThiF family adenylyltransferase [Armatimonadota bacterium]